MKSKLTVLIACVIFAQSAMAQFHIGVRAGANITKIEGKSFDDEFRYGYLLGGFAEIGLGPKFGLQPEVIFNQYQTRVDSNFKHIYQNATNFNETRKVKLNYLSIPVLLSYKFIGNFLQLQAGPQFGVLIDQDKNLVQNGQEAFKKGELSMVGGAQIKFSKFRLTGRYVVGLNDRKNIGDIGDQNKWKSEAIQLSLGVAL